MPGQQCLAIGSDAHGNEVSCRGKGSELVELPPYNAQRVSYHPTALDPDGPVDMESLRPLSSKDRRKFRVAACVKLGRDEKYAKRCGRLFVCRHHFGVLNGERLGTSQCFARVGKREKLVYFTGKGLPLPVFDPDEKPQSVREAMSRRITRKTAQDEADAKAAAEAKAKVDAEAAMSTVR